MPDQSPVVEIDVPLVRRLLAAQFPRWASLPVERFAASGWDSIIFRLGADLAVRMPRRELGARHLMNEYRWLPVIAPHLPLAVPVPLARGVPDHGYPWHWTIAPWLPGDMAARQPAGDQIEAAELLARFITALRGVDPTGGPASALRSVPLTERDAAVRTAIDHLRGEWDARSTAAIWQAATAAPAWSGRAAWTHGDLHPANLLTRKGRLTGVVDFGLLGLGDPASDLVVGWTTLSPPARGHLRRALRVDDGTWARARGRALDFGLMCAARAASDSVVGRIGRRTLDQVLVDAHPTL